MSKAMFWEKIRKNIISLSATKFAHRVVKVNISSVCLAEINYGISTCYWIDLLYPDQE